MRKRNMSQNKIGYFHDRIAGDMPIKRLPYKKYHFLENVKQTTLDNKMDNLLKKYITHHKIKEKS